ncbi:uncharacterized protein BO95DRAFT_483127 [Aspergillus brunneoviolaceus CBS 621.78]|uniref:Uncharacterized protein n=1 Tax=Aspergillus brunneoviolaceus CBS 621.78 TaxID=1450534 RepID=A0ACD1G568_9EURO|nr:hypothetical protein BO95DRAFT_483127 [Aspergillus brunneoviolaceus CBS 621.78]RAH44412.1 hypothetical protein BO95DRAFT_483127 [Aspergillus brunneoviolaceus CBS 621.78]
MPTPPPKPLPIIHINGFPGTGKLTIAQHLVAHYPPPLSITTTASDPPPAKLKLIHNHLLIDPADAVLHRTQPGYQALRHALRAAIFTTLTHEPATHATAYIFTDFQTTNAQGAQVCAEYAQAADDRGCALITVVLTCAADENLRRMMHADRGVHAKLQDVRLLEAFRRGAPVFRFSDRKEFLEVDVTGFEVAEVAARIWEHVSGVCPELLGG